MVWGLAPTGCCLLWQEELFICRSREEVARLPEKSAVAHQTALENYSCPYLGAKGCEVYGERPLICRVFGTTPWAPFRVEVKVPPAAQQLLVGVMLEGGGTLWADDVLLISRKGQAIRFPASDESLRPMGRATSGVTGMKFRSGDALLSMSIIDADMPEDDRFVFTVTDGGFAKRTTVSEYRQQGRGGLGIKAMKLNEDRGSLVGGLVVQENDEIMAIKTSGQIIRSSVGEVPTKGRDTMGVKFVAVSGDDAVSVIALYPESGADEEESTQVTVTDNLPESDTVGPNASDERQPTD